MNLNTSTNLHYIEKDPQNKKSTTWFTKLKPHAELMATIISGILILAGWFISKHYGISPSIPFYILAFLIGGFAKAKEGIEETLENKELNVELLMVIAAIGSVLIGYWTEGAVLIFIFSLSGALETYTMNKSEREINALLDLQPEEALLVQDGVEERVHVSLLKLGNRILVKPGERIPADGMIVKGLTSVDESAITGESLAVTKQLKDEVFAGTVNMEGSIIVEVTKLSHDTIFQKIIELIQSAQAEKSPSQRFIEKFEGTYVKAVLLIVAILLFLPHFVFGWDWTTTFYRAMVFLVVASPCALVAAIMPATLAAISNGARHGILFKGGIHLENLSQLKAIAFDKTGTLTKGKPVVTEVVARDGFDEDTLLQIAASIENESNHPLAQSIVKAAKSKNLNLSAPDELKDVPGFGITATMNQVVWKIGKADFVGHIEANQFTEKYLQDKNLDGKTLVFIENQNGIAGVIALKDTVRQEAKTALSLLRSEGIHTIMLTGDNEKTAKTIAEEAAIDSYVSECLPQQKVDELKKLKNQFGSVGMVGDGVNDAPALATATVGIAMGEGTDVALETADVVLMKNDLPRIAEAIRLSKRMERIIKQNIIFSISVIIILIASNFFQVLDLPFGVIGHEGSTILVILNGLRLLKS